MSSAVLVAGCLRYAARRPLLREAAAAGRLRPLVCSPALVPDRPGNGTPIPPSLSIAMGALPGLSSPRPAGSGIVRVRDRQRAGSVLGRRVAARSWRDDRVVGRSGAARRYLAAHGTVVSGLPHRPHGATDSPTVHRRWSGERHGVGSRGDDGAGRLAPARRCEVLGGSSAPGLLVGVNGGAGLVSVGASRRAEGQGSLRTRPTIGRPPTLPSFHVERSTIDLVSRGTWPRMVPGGDERSCEPRPAR